MKSVSVLIPTYQPGWYLERCLDSIECQTLPKKSYKVYLALNGPSDGYDEFVIRILKKYTFNWEYIYVEQAGVSNARNVLLERSCEDYIAFIDDDDVVSPDYLEQLLMKSSETFISVSNSFNFTDSVTHLTNNYLGISFSKLNDVEVSLFKSRKFFSSPVCKLIHRDIIGGVRFDPKLKIGEDSLYLAALSKRVSGVRKTASSACYYVCERQGSASRSKISRIDELRRLSYLIIAYSKMFFKGYNIPFILSRIVDSIVHVKRIF
ncbi:glycosyltransferase family 2 protein [Stutzerimonas stutzeri]|uniref:glycosyltransferase family 2 protein n=1 Tax=Stutzerimonas stutzeri TaxID=316 RepID=UPI0009B65065|nr:glycosyltransferase family 2 protein [Stutzerimonas stutzeri]